MPSTFTSNTGIEKIGDGEQTGTWGDTTNLNFDIVDRALNGSVSITLSGTTHTLTTSNGLLSDGQFAVLIFSGSPSGTNTVTIAPNTAQKTYLVRNTTAQSVVLTQGSGGNVTVPAGRSAAVYASGGGAAAAVVDISAGLVPVLTNAGVTSSTAELNILDGVTSTTAELNILDGVTATTAELNILDGVTASTAELNILDGVTSTTAELNLVDGSVAGTIVNSKAVVYGAAGQVNATTLQIAGVSVTSTAAELNILDGVTATTAEMNFVDGVTSNVQTQLNAKAPIASPTFITSVTSPIYTSAGNVLLLGGGLSGLVAFKNATSSDYTFLVNTGISATRQVNFPDGNVILTTGTMVNTTSGLSQLGVTSTAAELNILDGVTATAAELNFVDGVTSNVQTQLNTKAANATAATAGNGLTGGGTLNAAFTMTLGTPSTLTSTSTNAVTSTSHTHDIDEANIVANGMAGLAVGSIGTYAYLGSAADGTVTAGTTYAGSGLRYAGHLASSNFSDDTASAISATVPAGTWRAMGTANNVISRQAITLYLRIS
jgi:hypothetical protein